MKMYYVTVIEKSTGKVVIRKDDVNELHEIKNLMTGKIVYRIGCYRGGNYRFEADLYEVLWENPQEDPEEEHDSSTITLQQACERADLGV